ncbi:MAG: DUF5663 domain-containing protein, partial [bacterium]
MKAKTKGLAGGADLQTYVDRLVEEKKFPEDLGSEVMDQIKSDIMSQVEDRINAVIIDNLPEDKLEEFNKLLDSDAKDAEVQGFLSANIPD